MSANSIKIDSAEGASKFAADLYTLIRVTFPDERDQAGVISMLTCSFLLNVSNDEAFFQSIKQVMIEHLNWFDPYERAES